MNSKLYKLIFCRRLGCLIAVGEFTRSCGRSFSSYGKKIIKHSNTTAGILSRLAILTGFILGILPLRVFAHPSLPANGNIVAGQGGLEINSTTLTVTQHSDKLAINWESFDVAQGNSVIYNQPGPQSIALNRVLGSDASQIYGNLKANGQVFLLNPNGILFGKGAQVNVGGLVASTKSMSNDNFMSGRYVLSSQKHEGKLVNQANLHTTEGGYIALIGQQVDNQVSGVINAPQGKVAFTNGSRVTLNLDQGNLLGMQVEGEQVNTLLQNGGLIQADGGVIQLTAHGKEMLMNTVIDNTGILQARGLSEKNGVIYLNSGNEGVMSQQGAINVSSQKGRGGNAFLIGENIHLAAASRIDARGAEGGGKVLVGGGWQGKNKRIKNARSVVMDSGANIDVSSSSKGAGGTAVLWSESYTGFYGDIHARGGPLSGDGGKVETSSKSNLQMFGQVDTSASMGRGGSWLLDPAEVSIVGTGAGSGTSIQVGDIPAGYASNAQVFTPAANVTQILNTSINAQLNSGTNVTITTSNSSLTSCRWCNITLQADINKTEGSDATLTLHADGNIVSEYNIKTTVGKLNLNLLSGNSIVDSIIKLNNSNILLNGGDLLAKHTNVSNSASISIMGGKIEVGNLTLVGNTRLASQVGINISHAANITVAGETHITAESSNPNGQGWRSVDISDDSVITGEGNMFFTFKSNSKISWLGALTNATIAGENNITFKAVTNGSVYGGMDISHGNISSKSGNVLFDINGDVIDRATYGLRIQNSQVSGSNVNFEINTPNVDGFLLRDSQVTTNVGNISANATTTTNKGLWISGNTHINANGDIKLQGATTHSSFLGADAVKIDGDSSRVQVNISAGKDILIIADNYGNNSGAGIGIDGAIIETKNGNFTISNNGSKGVELANITLTANDIIMESNANRTDGMIINNANITASTDNIKIDVTAENKGIFIRQNTTLNAHKDLALTAESFTDHEAITVQGVSDESHNHFVAQGNISLNGHNSQGSNSSSVNLTNATLTSAGKNIDINPSSTNDERIDITNVDLNATAGNVTVYSAVFSALSNSTNAALSMGGNNSIKAQNGSLIGKAHTTLQEAGIVFRENSRLSIEGNVVIQGEVGATGTIGDGIAFQGANIVNITKGSQLALFGENKDLQSNSGGSGISYLMADDLTINNNGSLRIEGRSDNGFGIDFTANDNAVILNGAGDTLIKGSSATANGVAISGIVNNATGLVAIDGVSTHGAGVHLFGDEHQINRINVTGSSTQGEGIRISGNATVTDTALSGKSLNGSGIKIDSLPGATAIAYTVLDNAALNGSSANGKGVEVASDINGIHHSIINGTTDGTGYGIDIGNNLDVTGTSQTDLLTLQGIATRGEGTGIKLNGNNDLSNTSLNGSAIEGTALEIIGTLTSRGNTLLKGEASGAGTGVQLNGSLSNSIVNGVSASGIGVQLSGSLDDSHVSGISSSGSGVKVGDETILNSTMLKGTSTDGIGVEISANLSGYYGSAVQGDVVNGTGVTIDSGILLAGSDTGDMLSVTGNATGDTGTGVQLNGNNTLDNITLAGNATDGVGIDIDGPLFNKGNSVIDGKATSGDGVELKGVIAGGTVKGISDTGSGISINDDSEFNDTTLYGNSPDGEGIEIVGNLTGNHGSTVYGETTNGTGVEIGSNATLTGSSDDDPLMVTGYASGDTGTGVQLDGNNTFDNITLAGSARDGHGIGIAGLVFSNGNTTINGHTLGEGHGVHIDGSMNGGSVTGHSSNSHGFFLTDGAALADIKLGGVDNLHKPLMFIALPESIGNNVTINGMSFDKYSASRIKPDPTPTPVQAPAVAGKAISAQIAPPHERSQPGSLLLRRNQLLSSLDEQILPPPIVTESERDIAQHISIALCIPEGVAADREPCDTHILGKWKPLIKISGRE